MLNISFKRFQRILERRLSHGRLYFPGKKFPSNKQKKRNVTTLKSEKDTQTLVVFDESLLVKTKPGHYISLLLLTHLYITTGRGIICKLQIYPQVSFFILLLLLFFFFDRITRLKLTIKFWIRLLSGVLVDNLTSLI